MAGVQMAVLGLGVDDRGAIGALTRFTTTAHNAGRAGDHLERQTRRLTAAFGGLGAYFGIRQMVEYADTWVLINARVRTVTSSIEQANVVQEQLFQIGQRTRQSMAASAVLYHRLALSATELSASHQDLLNVVEAVGNSMLVAGSTGVEAAQSMRQLAQAFSKGKLDGDEFRTVMEAMPLVAIAITEQFGITRAELYKLAETGKLTASQIITALLAAQGQLAEQAAAMPVTIGQAWIQFGNAVERIIGIITTSTGAFTALSSAVQWGAKNIDKIAAATVAFTAVLVGYKTTIAIIAHWEAIWTAARNIGTLMSWIVGIRKLTDLTTILSLVGPQAAKAMLALGVGVAAYLFTLDQLNKATEEWLANNANLDNLLGETPGLVDEEALKRLQAARYAAEDMMRTARQELELASLRGVAAEKLKVEHEAINALIEARREYSGEALRIMEEAIEITRQTALQTVDVNAAVEEQLELAEELAQALQRYQDELQRTFADTFTRILRNGIDSFANLFDAIRQMFFRLMAEMASSAVMRAWGDRLAGALMGAFGGHKKSSQGPLEIPIEVVMTPTGPVWEPGAVTEVQGGPTALRRAIQLAGAGLAGYSIGATSGSSTLGALGGAGVGFAASGVLGALVGGLSGVAGALGKSQQEMARHRSVLASNNARLQQLRDSIHGMTQGSRFETAGAALVRMESYRRDLNTPLDAEARRRVDQYLSGQYGRDRREIEQVAKELGITLDGSRESFEQLREALELSIQALTTFGRNVQDISKRQEAYNRLYDVEMTPQRQLQDTYALLSEMAPELMKQLGLTNLNLDSEIGRNTLLEGMREIYQLIVSGQLTPELLGAFTDKNGLIDAILNTKTALDEFHKQLLDITTDFPRAMDIIYYEQKYGRYDRNGITDLGDTGVITERRRKEPWGFAVAGDVVINVDKSEDGKGILEKVEKAAWERVGRGGTVSIPTKRGSF